ncbi:FAD-binding monooxygenase [Actinosynnema sp. NPDC047251]|uniref:Monooxygenase, FAD-binding protein n=1 Tax=Saccharothrix espanaensis (strain ATCC 51144 / DSM 44229 / JCM 9112 / NBRC 15066 / NRRL 15764) TaxID=1179773 RepID=K0JYI1_SACES|nr:monooxygenase FAD-binding protein [Saccharothrix espanaensis]CCH31186.1 Monooxygenase, FAD-binding protein [Saccharothrix espanaensis DSM 44229]
MVSANGRRAVVLGGSMAGLLAARVLADRYDEVLVVDRDRLTGVTTARQGVPQGRHVHGLLARGQQVLDELFPGFTTEAVAAGVPTGDLGELRWFFNGRRLAPKSTGLTCVSAARPVLESLVRNRLLAIPNVVLAERHDILGLVTTPDRGTVVGVRVAPRPPEPQAERVVDADLVVDATGRATRTPLWLEEIGYARPPEDRIRIDLTYTTRRYRLPDESVLDGDLSINPVSTPSHPRGAFFSRVENGDSMLSLTGVLGDSAPTDDEGYLAFVRSLPVPDVYDVIKDARPLDDPVSFRYPASVRRRFEALDRMPRHFVVLGDAACSFNPVYGQGMTVAALESLTLRDHLAGGGAPDPLAFQRDVSAVIDVPWDISAGGDLGFPGVTGKRTLATRIGNAYSSRMQAAAVHDGEVTRTFMRVAGLVEPPGALMRPRMLLRVLGRSGRTAPPREPADHQVA